MSRESKLDFERFLNLIEKLAKINFFVFYNCQKRGELTHLPLKVFLIFNQKMHKNFNIKMLNKFILCVNLREKKRDKLNCAIYC